MENLTIIEKTIKAYVIEDKSENLFTVFSPISGSPLVSDKDRYIAIDLFKEALGMGCTISNIETYGKTVRESEKEIKKIMSTHNKPEVQFIDATI